MSEAAHGNDYIRNHDVVERFPFSIYHRPIRNAVLAFIAEREKQKSPLRILNVGCGLSHVLQYIPTHHTYQGVDVDPRVIEACSRRFADRNASFAVSEPYALPVAKESFDVVFATEVVEHVTEPERWLEELVSKLEHGGGLQLSTPKYGGWLLPFLERTVLEWIARRKGFTRKGLHPTPFTEDRLRSLLGRGGLTRISIRKTPFNLALVGTGYRA
jgi:2-polyprenyl-3-methyl-5-hydroxy-6-metoxy-1,4-benzoquinol methylase